MIVAFEGIDGAGKTTLAPLVAAFLRGQGIDARSAPKRAPGIRDEFVGEQLTLIAERLWGIPHDARIDSLGTPYWIYLNAAYFAGVHSALSRQEPAGRVTILDNWINKFVARVAAGGRFTPGELRDVLKLVPQPDLVVLLDITPAEAARRKLTPSDLEQGVLANGRLDFAGYQALVRDHLSRWAALHGWPTITLGERPANDIAVEAAQLIGDHLRDLSGPGTQSPCRPAMPAQPGNASE